MNAIEYENYVNFFKSETIHGADWRKWAVPKWATDNNMRSKFTDRSESMYMVYEMVLDGKDYVEKGKLKMIAQDIDGPELVRKVATFDDIVYEISVYQGNELASLKEKITPFIDSLQLKS